VRVLLDENLPHALASLLVGHDVLTVQGCGWAGLKNGVLLREAQGRIDAFVTMDANLEYQQRLIGKPFAVVVLHARSNRLADLDPIVPLLLSALENLAPGGVRHIGA
jgi:predicted nuclease of predicted toxin-antitoxin system